MIDYEHLKKVNLNYWNHFRLGMKCNWFCFLALVFGIIHTFIPFLFSFLPYKYISRIKEEVNPLYEKPNV